MGTAVAEVAGVVEVAPTALERPVYRGWPQVPEQLVTRTQLAREGLILPAGRERALPDAYCRTRAGAYPLYRRDAAVPRPAPRRPRRDYPALFAGHYVGLSGYRNWRMAVADAAEALFQLNRWAKHDDQLRGCTRRERETIYTLKNRFLHVLWREDHCTQAYQAKSPTKDLPCWDCDGKGRGWYDEEDDYYHKDDECPRCDGTGVYRTVGGKPYWALRFVVAGKPYAWHQPAQLASWAHAVGTPPEEIPDVTITVEPVSLSQRRMPEARALIGWVCDLAEAEYLIDDIPF